MDSGTLEYDFLQNNLLFYMVEFLTVVHRLGISYKIHIPCSNVIVSKTSLLGKDTEF